jgi:hypothetical protein
MFKLIYSNTNVSVIIISVYFIIIKKKILLIISSLVLKKYKKKNYICFVNISLLTTCTIFNYFSVLD